MMVLAPLWKNNTADESLLQWAERLFRSVPSTLGCHTPPGGTSPTDICLLNVVKRGWRTSRAPETVSVALMERRLPSSNVPLITNNEVIAAKKTERRHRDAQEIPHLFNIFSAGIHLFSAVCVACESSFCAWVPLMKGKSPQPVAKCRAAWIASCGHLNVTSCCIAVERGDEKEPAEKNGDAEAALGITSGLGISELHQLTTCNSLTERHEKTQ